MHACCLWHGHAGMHRHSHERCMLTSKAAGMPHVFSPALAQEIALCGVRGEDVEGGGVYVGVAGIALVSGG